MRHHQVKTEDLKGQIFEVLIASGGSQDGGSKRLVFRGNYADPCSGTLALVVGETSSASGWRETWKGRDMDTALWRYNEL